MRNESVDDNIRSLILTDKFLTRCYKNKPNPKLKIVWIKPNEIFRIDNEFSDCEFIEYIKECKTWQFT